MIKEIKPTQKVDSKSGKQQKFNKKRKQIPSFDKAMNEGVNSLKNEKKFNEMIKKVRSSMLKRAQLANEVDAIVNMEEAVQRSNAVDVQQIIDKYDVILKLANKDKGRWENYAKTGQTDGFIEDITNYSQDDWKEINSKLDTIIKDLDTVIVG